MTIQSMLKRLGAQPKTIAKLETEIAAADPVVPGEGVDLDEAIGAADDQIVLTTIEEPEALEPVTRFFATEAGMLDELVGTLLEQLDGAAAGRPIDPGALARKARERREAIRARGLKLAMTPRGKLPVAEMPAALAPGSEKGGRKISSDIVDLTLDAQFKVIGQAWKRRNMRALLAMQLRLQRDWGSKRANLPRDMVNFLLSVEYLVPDTAAPLGSQILAYDAKHGVLPDDLRAQVLEKTTLAYSKIGDHARARTLWTQLRTSGSMAEGPAQLLFADMFWRVDPDAALAALELARSLGGKISAGYNLLTFQLLLDRRGIDAAEEFLASHPRLGEEAMFALYNLSLRRDGFAVAQHNLQHAFTMRDLAYPRFNATDTFDVGMMASDLVDLPRAKLAHGKNPLVTVIMTAFNAAETIGPALASLRSQTWRELEIIVVDDRSTDDTIAIVETIAAEDTRVRLLRNQANIGTYMSRNRAMAQARGAFITFQDSDDWSHPQRIEKHMAVMGAEPHVMVSKSQWVRIMPDGSIPLRRWSRCFAHLNPSSLFFRKEALEATGYFDAVRADADFEMARRIDLVFAKPAVVNIPLPLSFGFVGAESLTRAGPTAMDEQGYSPVRSAYKAGWLSSYGERLAANALPLPAHPEAYGYRVPPEIGVPLEQVGAWFEGGAAEATVSERAAPDPRTRWGDRPPFWFIISLASAQSSANWERTVAVFRNTVRAMLNQDDPSFRIVVAGHERPNIPEMADPRVEFIVSDRRPPVLPKDFRADKMWKRRLIFQRIKEAGGGYIMPVDADDLVSRRIVSHVRSRPVTDGFVVVKGYALDWGRRLLSAVPGAWTAPFERVCGSSAVFLFAPEDLPTLHQEDVSGVAAAVLGPHANWRLTAEEVGKPLEEIDFPASVYVVNTAVNLSFSMQRAGERANQLLSNLARAEVTVTPDIIAEFALDELFNGPPPFGEEEQADAGDEDALSGSDESKARAPAA